MPTVRLSQMSESVFAMGERGSSLHAIIGLASAYSTARTSPDRGRLLTRYGLTACLLFVQCEFAHGSLTARSLPAAGPLRVHSSLHRLNGRWLWAVHKGITVTNHMIIVNIHVHGLP